MQNGWFPSFSTAENGQNNSSEFPSAFFRCGLVLFGTWMDKIHPHTLTLTCPRSTFSNYTMPCAPYTEPSWRAISSNHRSAPAERSKLRHGALACLGSCKPQRSAFLYITGLDYTTTTCPHASTVSCDLTAAAKWEFASSSLRDFPTTAAHAHYPTP